MCLGTMRIFAGARPYISERVDIFSEMCQWQTFFVMFAALLLHFTKSSLKNKKTFTVILGLSQLLGPAVMLIMIVLQANALGKKVARKLNNSSSWSRHDEDEDGKGDTASVEMNVLRKIPEAGAGEGGVTRSTRHLHNASSFGPKNNGKDERPRRDKRGKNLASNVRVSSAGLLALVKPTAAALGDESKPTTHRLRVNSTGLLAIAKVEKGSSSIRVRKPSGEVPPPGSQPPAPAHAVVYEYTGGDDDDDGAPSPPPMTAAMHERWDEQTKSEGVLSECKWTKKWDKDERAYYYEHEDGSSTWKQPREYWEG